MDVLDLHRGRLSWRRLRVLIEHLPPESATKTALRGEFTAEELAALAEASDPEAGRWSQLEQLTASIADAVRRVEHVLIVANTDEKQKHKIPPPPEPIPRPGTRPLRPKPVLSDDGRDFLFGLINGGAA
ncbi:hypothetical protein ACFY97_18900 [Streptomyces klenkii]|uniref:hypothetical protein n=1 Tax=Streptomyces klenkii TaxID=1420899 RepID=UPI0036E30C9E